ncbi:MAG TPA: hypothetical protein VMU89_19695 [Thermomicrobiaceae bacterium]|nr:hypothetical protein [Thermomicrobiaceae bacterium]
MHRDIVFTVDPDPTGLDRIDDLLTDAGFSPVLWSAMVVPSRMLAAIRPAVILLAVDASYRDDVRNLVARLRDSPATRTTPLILTSALADTIPDTELNAWQPVLALSSPNDPGALVAAVRRAAAIHSAEARLRYPAVPVADAHLSSRFHRSWPSPQPIDPLSAPAGADRRTSGPGAMP